MEEIIVSASGKSYLETIRKWAKFFFVLTIVAVVLLLVTGIIIALVSDETELVVSGVLYLVMSVVYIVPICYLNRALKSLKLALDGSDSAAFEDTLKNTKSLMKFMGIFSIVVLAMIPVVVVVLVMMAL